MSQAITQDTTQYIQNKSFDPTYQMLAVELVGQDVNNTTTLRRVQVDGNGFLISTTEQYTQKIEYDVNNNPIYVGFAAPGSATNTASWKIRKVTYDASNNPTDIQWADGSTAFNKVWDNRKNGTYTYS